MAVKTKEMREYLAKLVVEDGRSATELAYEHGIKPERVRDWARTYRKKQQPTGEIQATATDLKRRIAELEKKEKELKQENEILKKAMHVFAKDHT